MNQEDCLQQFSDKDAINVVYVGHYELQDVIDGVIAHGYYKVGRCTKFPALFRGRNQGGANFIVDYYHHVDDSWAVEKETHKLLKTYQVKGRQKELYDCELDVIINAINKSIYGEKNETF